MDIVVSGRRMEVSDKLRRMAEEKIGRLDRFLLMDRAEVVFTRETNPRIAEGERCEITLEGHGHHVRTKVAATEVFAALDKAIDKTELRLSKLKARIIDRSHGANRRLNGAAAAAAAAEAGGGVATAVEAPPAGPRIVKSKRFAMMPMTPEEAVGRMELLGHGFFFFTNIDTHRAAVVYRRDDGDVGLIDEAD